MIAEMMDLSRLDSGKLVLQKDEVNVNELIKSQVEKFASAIEEKGLYVQMTEKEVFLLEGDRKYLEKAFANLVDNAVCYGKRESVIRICIDSGQCTIENACPLLEEETLQHAFEMFYRGNKEEAAGEKHLGMGLYLAKKIFNMHHLEIILKNAADGVQVRIQK